MKDNTSTVVKLAVALLVLMTTASPSLPPNVSAEDPVTILDGEREVRAAGDDCCCSFALGHPYCRPGNPYDCWCDPDDDDGPIPPDTGNCVWWAFFKRPDTGKDEKNGVWGYPKDWVTAADAAGLPIGGIPLEGAIAVFDPGAQDVDPNNGHVAYVEEVPDTPPTDCSAFDVSEMSCGEHCERDASYHADGGNQVHFIYDPNINPPEVDVIWLDCVWSVIGSNIVFRWKPIAATNVQYFIWINGWRYLGPGGDPPYWAEDYGPLETFVDEWLPEGQISYEKSDLPLGLYMWRVKARWTINGRESENWGRHGGVFVVDAGCIENQAQGGLRTTLDGDYCPEPEPDPSPPPDPRQACDLLVSPPNPRVNENTSFNFCVHNYADQAITFQNIGPQGHGPPDGQGGLWNEFAHNVTIGAGQTVNVSTSRSFEWEGTWCIEHVPTQDQDGNWQDLPANGYRQAQCFDISSSPSPADLRQASDLQVSPAYPVVDQEVTFSYAVKNYGGESITIDTIIPQGHAYDDGQQTGLWNVPSHNITVGPGETVNINAHRSFEWEATWCIEHIPVLDQNGAWFDLPANGYVQAQCFNVGPVSTPGGATLYEHDNYGGQSETFTSDDGNLGDNAIRHDRATSVRVRGPYFTTLYEHPDYAGTAESFHYDDANLSDNHIGSDTVSSLRVYPAVALCEHSNFEGKCETFVSDNSRLNDSHIGHDTVTSIQVPSGYEVTLYEHPNYEGRSELFTDDDSNLTNNHIGNDVVSSIKVERIVLDGITLFEHENFVGRNRTFSSDEPNIPGEFVDMATSIKIRGPFMATVYEHPNYGGTGETFNYDDPDLPNNHIGSDTISSLKVWPAVALYEHTSYRGKCETFDSDVGNLSGTYIQPDTASSVKVPIGYFVTLCEHPNFEGACHTFISNRSNLSGTGVGSDTVSSITFATAEDYDAENGGTLADFWVDPGESFDVTISVRNNGNAIWRRIHQVRLGLLTWNDQMGVGDLRRDLDSGESVEPEAIRSWTISLTAPTTPGTYWQGWQMLREDGHGGWFGDLIRFEVHVSIPQVEYEALVALYNSTDGANWSNNSGWLDTNTPCNWYGVTCSAGHVMWLRLGYNQLNGSIPSQLGNLANLQVLYLYGNQLTGSIPLELDNLTNLLDLYLSDNQLTGSIPTELGSLTNLQHLSLASNQLSGSIPPELGNLANLQYLWLWGNQLTGSIPPQLGNLTNLQRLWLDINQLSGSIPPELGDLTNLQDLWLGNNQLSGSIPPELGNLTNLQDLYLHSNQLSGSIPPELGDLTNLTWLLLSSNQLSGALPGTLTNLTKLDHFWFYNTDLCEPADAAFQAWLAGISDLQSTGVICCVLFGDVDEDGDVDVEDIMQVASRWRTSCDNPDPDNNPDTPNYESHYDLDGDCDIDIVDIMLVVKHWGETCD